MSRRFIQRCTALLILLATRIPAAQAEELGRLFFSADERRVLNQKRALPAPDVAREALPKQELAASDEPTESVPLPPPKVTGRVTRSSGNDTVWMNHSPNYLPTTRRRPSRD